ncbi:MAG: hypothetical protein ACWIPH_05820 [Ostreibacterium sp.]
MVNAADAIKHIAYKDSIVFNRRDLCTKGAELANWFSDWFSNEQPAVFLNNDLRFIDRGVPRHMALMHALLLRGEEVMLTLNKAINDTVKNY